MEIFRQGDTTTITMELSHPLEDRKLKIGIYRTGGAPLYETIYPDNGEINKLDDTHYVLKLTHEVSMKLIGMLNLRTTIFSSDLSFVNSGENVVNMVWDKEPVNKNLK